MIRRHFASALAATIVAAVALSASPAPADRVDPGLPAYRPERPLAGDLTVGGGKLVEAWAREFRRFLPGVRLAVRPPPTDSDQTLDDLIAGRLDLAAGGFQREIATRQANGRPLAAPAPFALAVSSGGTARHPEFPAASPALGIFVNRRNPLSRLTLAELDAVFSRTRRRGYPEPIVRWGQLGLGGEWAQAPIRCYGMALHNQFGAPHGYVYFLADRVMAGGEFRPDLTEVPDTALGSGKNYAFAEVLRDVARDPFGIAYAPFDFRTPEVKSLALAEKAGGAYFAGTREEVAQRTYPLTMTNYLSARRDAQGRLDPLVREFFRYVLSREGQEVVAEIGGNALPLPAAFAAAERAKLR